VWAANSVWSFTERPGRGSYVNAGSGREPEYLGAIVRRRRDAILARALRCRRVHGAHDERSIEAREEGIKERLFLPTLPLRDVLQARSHRLTHRALLAR